MAERDGRAEALRGRVRRGSLQGRLPRGLLRRLRAASQRHRGAGSRLELGPDRRALRRTAAGEARAPARPGRPREREPDPRLGRRADRDAGVLRPLRPARPAGLAGVRPVEFGNRFEALGRSGLRRNDDRGRATDRPSPPCAAIARDLVRWQRARRRRLDSCARRAETDRARARPGPALAADLAGWGGGRPRAVGASGAAGTQRALRRANVEAAQRVRRRGDDESPNA